jgi:hypothetical protein
MSSNNLVSKVESFGNKDFLNNRPLIDRIGRELAELNNYPKENIC